MQTDFSSDRRHPPPQPPQPHLSTGRPLQLPAHLQAALWQGDQLASSNAPTCPSGHAALDAQLPGGGWPTGSLSELLLDGPGQGEWRLLAPALAQLGRAGGEWVGIAPPLRPHAPALQALGLDLGRALWVDTPHSADAAWAAEQALRSHSCAAVLWWTDESPAHPLAGPPRHRSTGHPQRALMGQPPPTGPLPHLHPGALRRLHLAAQASGALLFVLRPASAASQASPAALRLHCRALAEAPQQLSLQILKRRGPPLAEPLLIDTGVRLAPALAHRLSQPMPQDRRLPARPRAPMPTATATAPGAARVA